MDQPHRISQPADYGSKNSYGQMHQPPRISRPTDYRSGISSSIGQLVSSPREQPWRFHGDGLILRVLTSTRWEVEDDRGENK